MAQTTIQEAATQKEKRIFPADRAEAVKKVKEAEAKAEAAQEADRESQLSPEDLKAKRKAEAKAKRKAKAEAAKATKAKEAAKAEAKAEAKETTEAVQARKAEAEAARTNERKAIREAIKLLPSVSFPVVTESGSPAIERDGKQINVVFSLSNFSQSVGLYLEKQNADTYIKVNGCIVKIPASGQFGSRYRAVIKLLTPALFKKPEAEETRNFALALREKYDFPIIDKAGKFCATESGILEAMRIHENAKRDVSNLDKVLIRGFGYNPEKLHISAECRKVRKAVKDGNISEATEAANNVQAMRKLPFLS